MKRNSNGQLNNKNSHKRIQQLFNKVELNKRLTLLEQKELISLVKGNYASVVIVDIDRHFNVLNAFNYSVNNLITDLINTKPTVHMHLTLHMVDNTTLDIKATQPIITQKI